MSEKVMKVLTFGAGSKLFDKPKPPKLPPPPPTAIEDVAGESQSASRTARKKFGKRFGRRNTVLAGAGPLGTNTNAKSVLGV